MSGYKENGNETKIDEGEVVGYLAGYNPEGSESCEQDEAASTMPYSGGKDDILSTLAEPEDWQRGYD